MKRIVCIVGLLLAAGTALFLLKGRTEEQPEHTFLGPTETPALEANSCVACHPREVDQWRASQHAHANRSLRPEDATRFKNAPSIAHGPFKTTPQCSDSEPLFTQTGGDGISRTYAPVAVIAVEPLIQYLIPFGGGRLQVFDGSYDTVQHDWFHVFGEDVRGPGDWGYWTNRSMVWNARCADCHMTNFKKNYDMASDSYASTWDHMGISCSQCHGDLSAHAANPKDLSLLERSGQGFTLEQHVAICADCHSRREDLTGNFAPGDPYADHFRLALLTEPGLYYADGQIRDEVFEYTSFSASKKHDKGITCFDCHNAHSGELVAPIDQNQLCMTCHIPPGLNGAAPVDPLTHSFHASDNKGHRCVECHMPQTKYMVRDPRRDHAFTIPDPLLTIQHGIPNACNRCHTDKTPEWALSHCETWYGDRMNRPTRERAQIIARATDGQHQAFNALIAATAQESNAVWKASMLMLLDSLGIDAAGPLFGAGLNHASDHVRSVAARALAPMPQARTALEPLRADPVRKVRLDAAWATLGTLDRGSPLYDELMHYVTYDADQPSGALRLAQLALAEQRHDDAAAWMEKAVAWDASPGSLQMQGRMFHAMGRIDEAIAVLERSLAAAPEDASIHYTLALIYGEVGRTDETLQHLKLTVKYDPGFGRAWYNLGLALSQQNDPEAAVQALTRAEDTMPLSPDPAYAAATIHLRTGARDEARAAAERALSRAPRHGPSQDLLRGLQPPGP